MSAHRAAAPDGAVAMIDGRGEWWIRAAHARDGGAAALVVSEPATAPAQEIWALADATTIPVVVQRSRLRPSSIDALRARLDGAPTALVAEAIATARDADVVLRDAAGWMRELGGGPVGFVAIARGGSALSAAGTAGASTASILLTESGSRAPLLDIVGIAPLRSEVRLDEATGAPRLAVAGADGTWIAPVALESVDREALRAAIDAVGAQPRRNDLRALAEDADAIAPLLL
ncbi:hypothetical protein [Microbacterium sp. G2-8]|uniref:hypothetical protein n=1 Tax=Microbacterium sp. G2-8 TaxID=2842454 RepID=UPI001C8AD85A|nr:hypothetical protein [Microbacterium sp. G2-8]